MKKYRQSSLKLFVCLTILCFLMIVVGIVLIIFAPEQLNWILLLLGMGLPFGIVCVAVLIPTARNYLLLDDERIVLPITRAPKLRFKRNVLLFSQIKYIQQIYHKGDGITTLDTKYYRFVLDNGVEFTETFYSYGKEGEEEIVSFLKERIRCL